jgi:hypothetical protein
LSLRLPRREIDWNESPWKVDIFEDNDDMHALRTSIVTINHALTVGLLTMYFLPMYLLKCADELAVLWQSLAERAKSRVDLLKNTAAKEQQIIDLEQEFKQVHEAAAAEKKRLEDELAEEKRKAKEATAQFKTVSIGRSNLCVGSPCSSSKKVFLWYANCDVS